LAAVLILGAVACGDGGAESEAYADPGGTSELELEVTTECHRFCMKQAMKHCMLISLMGGLTECASMFCDMSGRSAACLEAHQTFFDCANHEQRNCDDCMSEFKAISNCSE
jgi:hypothetical protein